MPAEKFGVCEDAQAGEQELDDHGYGDHVRSPHKQAAGGFPHLGGKPSADRIFDGPGAEPPAAAFCSNLHES